MSINILMPALSPTMTEGKLAKWHVKVGDTVKSGQVICEIETDKATMEVEAVDEGKIGQIVVPEGAEGVAVNAVIAILLEEGETAVPAGAAPAPAVIARMKEIGFDLTHVYGLTEVYGPASVCAKQEHWESVSDDERSHPHASPDVILRRARLARRRAVSRL